MSYFLALEVKQIKRGIFISQGAYVKEVVKTFKIKDCKPIGTPTSMQSNYLSIMNKWFTLLSTRAWWEA